jgi:hypothetical protein
VVDVDDEPRPLEERIGMAPEAALVRTVDGHDRPLLEVVGKRTAQVVELHEAVFVGQRRLAGEVGDGVLSELFQGELGREEGAEGVAVRVFMGRDDEALVSADGVGNPPQVRCLVRLGRFRVARARR